MSTLYLGYKKNQEAFLIYPLYCCRGPFVTYLRSEMLCCVKWFLHEIIC